MAQGVSTPIEMFRARPSFRRRPCVTAPVEISSPEVAAPKEGLDKSI
jgi:hypothetical protein